MPHRYPDTALNLEILSEESAEVIAEMIAILSRVIRLKSKITRFGIDDHHPGNGAPNRQALETELGHLLAMIHCLTEHGILDWKALNTARQEKLEKMTPWYRPGISLSAQPSGIRCSSQCTGTCGSENLCPAAVASRG